jgi:hypothetical protein
MYLTCNLFSGQETEQPKKSFLAVPSVQAPFLPQLALDATSESTQGRNGSAIKDFSGKSIVLLVIDTDPDPPNPTK